MSSTAAEIKVLGLVQGVGFRHFCHSTATKLALTGFVKNQPDRSVLVIAEGDRSMIETLIKSLKVGPAFSTVKDVSVRWIDYSGQYDSFSIMR